MSTRTNLAYAEDALELEGYREVEAGTGTYGILASQRIFREQDFHAVLEFIRNTGDEEFSEIIHRRTPLEELQNIDPQTVDRSTLVDVADIRIDESLPIEERLKEFIRQVKNPYCYLDHGRVVKISFTGTRSMEDLLLACAESEANSLPGAIRKTETAGNETTRNAS